MNYEILLPNSSFKECAEYIRRILKKYTMFLRDTRYLTIICGDPAYTIAVDNDNIIMPYVKPCHGCFVLRVPGIEEIGRLRK